MNTIGQRIRYARKMNKLSLTEVKEMTGLSTGNLSELENDKFAPSAKALISLKNVLNVSIDWILTGEEPVIDKKLINTKSNTDSVNEDNNIYLTDMEAQLIKSYRLLDEDKKRDILGYLNVLTYDKDFNNPK